MTRDDADAIDRAIEELTTDLVAELLQDPTFRAQLRDGLRPAFRLALAETLRRHEDSAQRAKMRETLDQLRTRYADLDTKGQSPDAKGQPHAEHRDRRSRYEREQMPEIKGTDDGV
jgi:hypothetical protein